MSVKQDYTMLSSYLLSIGITPENFAKEYESLRQRIRADIEKCRKRELALYGAPELSKQAGGKPKIAS